MKVITVLTTLLTLSPTLFANTQDTAKVKITHVFINDISMPDTAVTFKLKGAEDDLVFEFEKPTVKTHSTFYSYQLEGFDKKFKQAKYPTTRYTNLKGGNFTFKVRMGNDDRTLITRTITVDSALSDEWWFRPSLIFYVLLVVGAIAYFWNIYNLRQKLKVQTLRNNIAADLHDEVGATLSSIGISIRTIQKRLGKNAPEVMALLEKMKVVSAETNLNLRDTVWAINPENDTFDKVFDRMSTFACQILQDLEIQCVIDNQIDMTKAFKITMEQRRNVYLIFKEAVNNIAKHAEATKVTITMKEEKDGIRLTLEDNGKGFNITDNYEGNGLKNYRRRAAESFIEFDIKSTPSVGTWISMLIPEL